VKLGIPAMLAPLTLHAGLTDKRIERAN
jgi:hypothetical protein